ncbi:hypothetical protein M388_02395 [Mesotoga sp. Brook.08.YT.4.2.5.4.]|nr:hypothetical protein M388_02395 [Mesotoga sp. Brook.08.YT.4.2.5.4.]
MGVGKSKESGSPMNGSPFDKEKTCSSIARICSSFLVRAIEVRASRFRPGALSE